MNKKTIIFTYCIGFVLTTAGFVIDGFNSLQQHSAFSSLGITFYVLGGIVLALGVVFVINTRKR